MSKEKEKSALTVGMVLEASAIQFDHSARTLPEALRIGDEELCQLFDRLEKEAPMRGKKSVTIENILKMDAPTSHKAFALFRMGEVSSMGRDPFLEILRQMRSRHEESDGD